MALECLLLAVGVDACFRAFCGQFSSKTFLFRHNQLATSLGWRGDGVGGIKKSRVHNLFLAPIKHRGRTNTYHHLQSFIDTLRDWDGSKQFSFLKGMKIASWLRQHISPAIGRPAEPRCSTRLQFLTVYLFTSTVTEMDRSNPKFHQVGDEK